MDTDGRVNKPKTSVAAEDTRMLCDPSSQPRLTEFDLRVFDAFVPPEHCLRRALAVVPWGDFHAILAPFYSPDQGRPSDSPVLMLKFEYLRYHYNLSDRQVIERAKTDMAFRYFLQVDVYDLLPDPSSLCLFRGRLGPEGFRKVFRQVVGTAREHGLVKDRLRLKDATHVIADIAIPTTLGLVAQIRDKLLTAAEPFDTVRVAGEQVNIELLRERTQSQSAELRLVARVTHLREMLAWMDGLTAPEDAASDTRWQKFLDCRALAHKILFEHEHPDQGDRTRSVVDPDARRSKHGDWYDGYSLDILVDADSEIITEVNVLPANGDEAADALKLIRQEEAAHGNDVEALSIDGIGFNGRLLRELEDPDGLAVNTFVPPKREPPSELYTAEDFTENESKGTVTCPAGQKSRYRQREPRNRGWTYRFTRKTCDACPLVSQCMQRPGEGAFGKTIRISDYAEEYTRARQKAQTEDYLATRREHPKVERKLGEVANRHGGRRANYHGHPKVMIQELMACTAANVKRIIRLLCGKQAFSQCPT
jgi:transposase